MKWEISSLVRHFHWVRSAGLIKYEVGWGEARREDHVDQQGVPARSVKKYLNSIIFPVYSTVKFHDISFGGLVEGHSRVHRVLFPTRRRPWAQGDLQFRGVTKGEQSIK